MGEAITAPAATAMADFLINSRLSMVVNIFVVSCGYIFIYIGNNIVYAWGY